MNVDRTHPNQVGILAKTLAPHKNGPECAQLLCNLINQNNSFASGSLTLSLLKLYVALRGYTSSAWSSGFRRWQSEWQSFILS